METTYTLEKSREIHASWKESGLSIKNFCVNNGINESKFFYWKRKLDKASLPASPNGCFVPVEMTRTAGRVSISHRKGIQVAQSDNPTCRIVYPNGVSLVVENGLSIDVLRALINM